MPRQSARDFNKPSKNIRKNYIRILCITFIRINFDEMLIISITDITRNFANTKDRILRVHKSINHGAMSTAASVDFRA